VSDTRVLLEIDGAEAADLYPDLTQVEVELDEDEAAMFRVELSITLGSDGAWDHVDDERLVPWKRVSLQVGFGDGFEPLVSGHLTRVDTTFEAEASRCRVELWGSDGSALLDRTERLRAWPDKKDSDIATEIFAEYALDATVDVTAPVHGVKVSTIVQRETDLQFLRRLARRNGFECFVEDGRGFFRAQPPPTDPQPVLAAHFGDETTVTAFAVRLDARTPTDVGMFQLDRTEKTVLTTTVTDTPHRALGATRAADLRPAGLAASRAYVAMSASTGAAEMAPLCQGLYDRNDFFVTGEGVVDGARYGTVLRPRRPVTIKGVGERHSGLYLVTHVTHTLDAGGYVQRFRVKRNGVGLTGAEDFGAAGAGLLGVLA
jgi:phage protein D